MVRRSEKPDFIGDQFGNVQDVRHQKYLYGVCPECGEEYEPQLDVCWNCGTWRDGTRSRNFELEKEKVMTGENEASESLFSLAAAGGQLVVALLGGLLIVAGIVLAIGNESGAFPTFPYAGCLTQLIGWVILAAGMKWLEGS